MGALEGKVAFITGAASGIGRGVAKQFVEQGARIGVLDINREGLVEFAETFGSEIHTIHGDVTQFQDHQRAVKQTLERFGRVDVLVANAGLIDGGRRFEELSGERLDAAFTELFNVNVKGYLLAARAALPALKKSKGNIILTASISSFRSSAAGGALYVASKHAVAGLVQQLARELAPDVRVNGVAPGVAPTQMGGLAALEQDRFRPTVEATQLPLGFVPNVKDYAGAYVFLASEEHSRAMTGSIILVDSGLSVGSKPGAGS